jgi:glycosyltransferase involved in cell wall biosynthesis
MKRSTLIVGPLPPPNGGARISFKLFISYLISVNFINYRLHELPVRKKISPAVYGGVDHFKTCLSMLRVLMDIPAFHNVVVFGSRGFCFSYGSILLIICKLLGKKCYIRFFGGRPILQFKKLPAVLKSLILQSFRWVEKIVVQTQVGASEFPDNLLDKVEVVSGYRECNSTAIHTVKDMEIIRYVYVGLIAKEKGIDLLTEVFSEIHSKSGDMYQVELHLYGMMASEKIRSRLTGQPDVYIHGVVENEKLREELHKYDIFVFPTIYNNEGHPGAMIEALMAGLPVIASDFPVIREVISHDINGWLVRPGDISELCSSMLQLASDLEIRKRLSINAFKSSRKFSLSTVLPQLAATLGLCE